MRHTAPSAASSVASASTLTTAPTASFTAQQHQQQRRQQQQQGQEQDVTIHPKVPIRCRPPPCFLPCCLALRHDGRHRQPWREGVKRFTRSLTQSTFDTAADMLAPHRSSPQRTAVRCDGPQQGMATELPRSDAGTEPGDLRAVAMRWAQRTRKFPGPEVDDMGSFASELAAVGLPPASLRVGAMIGQGAFGTIHRAELDGRAVAAKYIESAAGSSHALNDIMYKARGELEILREIRQSSDPCHPNIVEFLGAIARFPSDKESQDAWRIGYVMELCEGGELNDLLHVKKFPFSMPQKISMARDAACGVAYLHSLKIFHRDLNTRNLLLTRAGSVKVCDFGCARQMKTPSFQPRYMLGSLAWMSPEQVSGKEPISMKSDNYSFGVIMWELATAILPFNHIHGQPYPSQLNAISQVSCARKLFEFACFVCAPKVEP